MVAWSCMRFACFADEQSTNQSTNSGNAILC